MEEAEARESDRRPDERIITLPFHRANRGLGAHRIPLHPKDDPVRMQGVLHRMALAQKLRIPGDFDVDSVWRQRGGPVRQLGRGAHRNRRFTDEHRWPGQPRYQRVDDGMDMAQVGAVLALLLRRAHAEDRRRNAIPSPTDVINEHLSEKLRECSRAQGFGGNNEYHLAAIRLHL